MFKKLKFKITFKKLFVSLFILFVASCENVDNTNLIESNLNKMNIKHCSTIDIIKKRSKKDKNYKYKMIDYSKYLKDNRITDSDIKKRYKNSNNKIHLKFVINQIYHDKKDKLKEGKVKKILKNIQNDFNRKNKNYYLTPEEFKKKSGIGNFKFSLHKIRYRKYNRIKKFDADTYDVHYYKYGGINQFQNNKYVNIWIVDSFIDNSILGYASFPVEYKEDYDGVVIPLEEFTETVGDRKSKTMTHELGHFMGLMHIWGDFGYIDDEEYPCKGTDWVSDTNNQAVSSPYGEELIHPRYSCGSKDMFQNYMDYSSDKYMSFFTKGQIIRARNTFKEDFVRPNYGMKVSRYPMTVH